MILGELLRWRADWAKTFRSPRSGAGEAGKAFATDLPVRPVKLDHPVSLGQPDSRNSKAVIASIERAVALTNER